MAKQSYKVPAAINRSFLDHEISLSKGGWPPPMPTRQIAFIGGGAVFIFWACMQTFIGKASAGFIALFIIWAAATVLYFGQMTKTKQLKAEQIPALLSYAPPSARTVYTRRSSDPSGFFSIANITSISKDGIINFSDGGVGQLYRVVGSASYLLFDEDRSAILNRVDAFWRKVEPTCEFCFITTKEPQRIYRQVAHLERRNKNLEIRDPDLIELQNEQYDILTGFVGGQFSSIHQYLLIKGVSADALRRGHMVLRSERENSSLMIREASVLDGPETEAMLSTFYRGVYNAPTATPFA